MPFRIVQYKKFLIYTKLVDMLLILLKNPIGEIKINNARAVWHI